MNQRTVAMACRCQLLTGSYEGNERCCSCRNPSNCKFSEQERRQLKTHPKVFETCKRNLQDFERKEQQ